CLETLQHLVEHGPVEREGPAEIALEQVAEPDQVSLGQGLVEAELRVEAGDVFGRGEIAEDGGRRVARDQRHDQEHDQREPEQDGNRGKKLHSDVGNQERYSLRKGLTSVAPHSVLPDISPTGGEISLPRRSPKLSATRPTAWKLPITPRVE